MSTSRHYALPIDWRVLADMESAGEGRRWRTDQEVQDDVLGTRSCAAEPPFRRICRLYGREAANRNDIVLHLHRTLWCFSGLQQFAQRFTKWRETAQLKFNTKESEGTGRWSTVITLPF